MKEGIVVDKTRRPPGIIHIRTRPDDNREQLCLRCGMALHMSRLETQLLRFYAAQEQGYTPALQHVANCIHCSRSTVEHGRSSLQRRGIILMSIGSIYVDWNRIRLFSTLDPAKTRRCRTAAPVSLSIRPDEAMDWDIFFLHYADQEEVCRYLSGLSAQDYQSLKDYLRSHQEDGEQASQELVFSRMIR